MTVEDYGQQDSSASSPECVHNLCATVRAETTKLLYDKPDEFGIHPSAIERALCALPLLLCKKGEWPPTVALALSTALLDAFCRVCVDKRIEGLHGQQLPGYAKAVERLQKAQAQEPSTE